MAERLVASVFKTLMFAMIFVFIFDIAGYMYKALSLNQRMEGLMSSLRQTVTLNNGLSSTDAKVYQDLFYQIAADMNGVTYNPSSNTGMQGGDNFIVGMDWNYKDKFEGNLKQANMSGTTLRQKMSDIGNYGDIQTIYVTVTVKQPIWGFTGSHSSENFGRLGGKNVIFKYLEYVPCLNY